MITVDQYFGFYKDCEDVTEERRQNAILNTIPDSKILKGRASME